MRSQFYPLFAQAEARAEFAERSVQKLQKEVDRLEGKSLVFFVFDTNPVLSFETPKNKVYFLHANRNNQKNSRVNSIQNPNVQCYRCPFNQISNVLPFTILIINPSMLRWKGIQLQTLVISMFGVFQMTCLVPRRKIKSLRKRWKLLSRIFRTCKTSFQVHNI